MEGAWGGKVSMEKTVNRIIGNHRAHPGAIFTYKRVHDVDRGTFFECVWRVRSQVQ